MRTASRTSHALRIAAFIVACVAGPSPCSALGELVFEDIFNQRVNERGITLVDWDGQIANPLIRISITPPADATFPATGVVTSTEPRLYFSLPSNAGASGPSKSLTFPNSSTKVPLFLSIFPDRDTSAEDHALSIRFTSANGIERIQPIDVHVLDQDTSQPPAFNVIVDPSQDQTGFFNESAKRDVVRQAAEDWAYFFAGMNLNMVAANAEKTFIWNPDGFNSGHHVRNATAYTGFLLYAYGIDAANPPYRSGGEPSFSGGFQSSGAMALPLKRSGGVEIEIKGNFNTLGWFLTTSDDDWWKASNLSNEQNDLYSIAHHEIGHSLIFNPSHTKFGQFKSAGKVQDARVVAYHGSEPAVDAFDHLDGSLDRLSKKGVFGYEYFGDVPRRRWLITKLDLLVAQAVGYALRQTSAFQPLAITTASLPHSDGVTAYSQPVEVTGGIPTYHWEISAGTLPAGLSLNPVTGIISGQPAATGTFDFTVRVRDNDSTTTPVTRALSIAVQAHPPDMLIELNGPDVLLRLRTLAGRNYRIERADRLVSAAWNIRFHNVPGTGGIVTVTDPNAAANPRLFYRADQL